MLCVKIHFLHSDPSDTAATPISTPPSFRTTMTSAQLCPQFITHSPHSAARWLGLAVAVSGVLADGVAVLTKRREGMMVPEQRTELKAPAAPAVQHHHGVQHWLLPQAQPRRHWQQRPPASSDFSALARSIAP